MNQPTPAQPGASSRRRQESGAQLAAWNGPRRISKMPASVGTVARGPEEAAHTMLSTPQRLMKAAARSTWRGLRSGAYCSSAGPTFTPSA